MTSKNICYMMYYKDTPSSEIEHCVYIANAVIDNTRFANAYQVFADGSEIHTNPRPAATASRRMRKYAEQHFVTREYYAPFEILNLAIKANTPA